MLPSPPDFSTSRPLARLPGARMPRPPVRFIETAWAAGSQDRQVLKPVGVVFFQPGVGKGTQPRREGRAESVPEAGGTGAEAVATSTRPTAGHAADSPGAHGLDGR